MKIEKGGSTNLLVLLPLIFIILLLPSVSKIGNTVKTANDSNFIITQIKSNLPDVTLFVRLENVDMDSAKLKKNLSIRINDSPTQITKIQPVKNENGVTENTAYMILVDTSVSMQNQNQLSQLQILLEKLLGSVETNDKIAVFGVTNTLEIIKDFMETDPAQSVIKTITNRISSNAERGTYLYSGVRTAFDKVGTAKDIPTRRIIVLITDGGVDGDYLSSNDIQNYVDVDRLPVYTLILNQQNSVDQEFKTVADQITQKTGGQSFLSTSGNELYAQFKTSIENCSMINLRCDNFKAFNLQAVMNVTLKGEQGEIRQAARFTATPAPIDQEQSSRPEAILRTSYFGVAVIIIPILTTLILCLAFFTVIWRHASSEGETSPGDKRPE